MVLSSLSLVGLKRNYFITKQKKKMVHIDLKSLRYKIWLWLVREIELWRILMANYNKVPSMTPTKIITWLLLKWRPANLLLSLVERRVRRRISCVNSVKTFSRRELKERRIIERYLRSQSILNHN